MKSVSKLKSKSLYIVLFSLMIIILFSLAILFSTIYRTRNIKKESVKNETELQKKYHIIVTGNYDNELFLKNVYEGAKSQGDNFDAVVELYVPSSRAEDISYKSLFEYATFVNADGVIAYIDSSDFSEGIHNRTDNKEIPLVTTGVYSPFLPQISFIGNNWWEVGKKIGDEVISLLNDQGIIYLVIDSKNKANYNSLTNSLYETISSHKKIKLKIIDKISNEIVFSDGKDGESVVICLTEESTIQTAQITQELKFGKDRHYKIVGFGSNETCQHYLNNGTVSELIYLDPEKIGSAAINQIFEYYNLGYANSYISADVKIQRSLR